MIIADSIIAMLTSERIDSFSSRNITPINTLVIGSKVLAIAALYASVLRMPIAKKAEPQTAASMFTATSATQPLGVT